MKSLLIYLTYCCVARVITKGFITSIGFSIHNKKLVLFPFIKSISGWITFKLHMECVKTTQLRKIAPRNLFVCSFIDNGRKLWNIFLFRKWIYDALKSWKRQIPFWLVSDSSGCFVANYRAMDFHWKTVNCTECVCFELCCLLRRHLCLCGICDIEMVFSDVSQCYTIVLHDVNDQVNLLLKFCSLQVYLFI